MNAYNLYSLMADIVLLCHALFIAFLIGGQISIIVGRFQNWQWVRNLSFRISHILAMGIVLGLTWANQVCPLTIWENALRYEAGGSTYKGTFVTYWLNRMIYYEAPHWVFMLAYSSFGAIMLISWIWVRPQKGKKDSNKA
jgi:hypothetical protein